MAKMKDVAPVSEYQLVQLASVANTVGRAENRPVTAALKWLADQVEDHQLPSRLFSLPTSPPEKIVEWAPTGDTSQWQLILRKTERRENKTTDDEDRMPSIAQSRYLHVDDLIQLAASADTSEPCRAALLELVARQGVTPRSHAGASQSASLSAAEPVPVAAAVQVPDGLKRWTPAALEELRAYRELHNTKKAAEWAGMSTARVRELLPAEKPPPKGYSAFNRSLK